jgi:hypothetical protein
MNLFDEAHSLVAELLRASPTRPKRNARTWARHEMVRVALPELEQGAGTRGKEARVDRARERAAEWLNEHGDDTPPADFVASQP